MHNALCMHVAFFLNYDSLESDASQATLFLGWSKQNKIDSAKHLHTDLTFEIMPCSVKRLIFLFAFFIPMNPKHFILYDRKA